MSQFLSVLRFEFRNSIRRTSLWIAYGMLFAFYSIAGPDQSVPIDRLWAYAAQDTYGYNILLPIVGGILATDRMQRDMRLGVNELQRSAPFSRAGYILSKYLGVLFSVLVPVVLWLVINSVVQVVYRHLPTSLIPVTLVTCLAITVPAYAFIVAFSLACPLVMPIRVYQILFTGYWVWGNFLNSAVFPTLSGTILTPGGIFALQGFFRTDVSQGALSYTAWEASLNLLVLTLCIVMVLVLLDRYLRRRAQRA